MKGRFKVYNRIAEAILLLGVIAGCSTNPATGEKDFTPFMTPSQELAIGEQEHPKILEQFGGAYDNAGLAGYVATIGGRMASVSELPELNWTFTLLNTPVPNAFALPGGYVYVTRGLLSIMNSEAELAGVIGHEIGHVTARHSAQRYTSATGAGLLAAVAGIVTGSQEVAQAAQIGAAAYLSSYSRSQEYQSDELGIRYLDRAGYDPYAQADVLAGLGAETALQARIAGRDVNEGFDFFSTHPNTPDRVDRARQWAGEKVSSPGLAPRHRDRFMDALDGMLYGDDPEQGIIDGRRFIHPSLRLTFEVPEGFRMLNGQSAVTVYGPNDAALSFDAARVPQSQALVDYLSGDYGKGLDLQEVKTGHIDGMPVATGTAQVNSQSGPFAVRIFVIRYEGDRVYRFTGVSPPNSFSSADQAFRATAQSFRKITAEEAANVPVREIDVITVARGQTASELAERMAFDAYQMERFLTMNGLQRADQLQAGQTVKVVVKR